jgi:hypothetical protein
MSCIYVSINSFFFISLEKKKMDSKGNFSNISNNIISIFTVLFFFILLMIVMSYSASKSRVNELEYKIAKMSQERDQQSIREIKYMEAIRDLKNLKNLQSISQTTNECVKKSELQSLLQIIQSQNKAVTSANQNYIKNSNQISPSINEIYPVPVIPGGEFLKRGVISMRNVDFPYQDITTVFQRVGTIATADKNDDYVMTLYRRDIAPERDLYEYKVNDNMNGSNIEIFLDTNISLLRNGDRIIVPGFESKGEFIVKLDRQYSYIRLRPFP